jgi:hypothetical protein
VPDGTLLVLAQREPSNASAALRIDFDNSIVSHRDVLTVFKTDRITTPGFFPVPFARNLTKLAEGRYFLTVVAYRAHVVQNHTNSENGVYLGGGAEFPFQVSTPQYCGESPYYLDFDAATQICGGIDAPDRVALCVWTLTFPEIEFLGEDYEEIPSGTYEMDGFFFSDMSFYGLAVRMTARLDHRLFGNAMIQVRAGHNENLVLYGDVSEDELWFQTPFDPYEFGITINVTSLTRGNYLVLEFYGQTTHWYV